MVHYLKPEKSPVYDEITSKILKTCASLINQPLSFIYSSSLYGVICGEPFQIAIVKPLYRKEDKTSMTNYRPISLLAVFSKVFEKAMHSRLSLHLHTNAYLSRKSMDLYRKGYQLKILPSDSQIVNWNCMLEKFSAIWQRLLIAWIIKFCYLN